MKLKYFKDRKWKPEWISRARTILTERFHESYAGRFGFQNSKTSGWESSSSHASSEVCFFCLLSIRFAHNFQDKRSGEKTKDKKANRFDDDGAIEQAGGAASTPPANEVDHFLDSDIEQVKSKDLITWWKSKARIYPCLSRMALDYLSIPGELATDCSCIVFSVVP
jgi:hypothetical protein